MKFIDVSTGSRERSKKALGLRWLKPAFKLNKLFKSRAASKLVPVSSWQYF